jgi:hypothetical protein
LFYNANTLPDSCFRKETDMANREAAYPCRPGAPGRRPGLTLRLWLYRLRLRLLCRLAFAGRKRRHAGQTSP